MLLATWLLFLVTDVALSLTPGPAVLFVVGTGLRHGFRASIGANLGVLSANLVYFAISAFGLGVLLATAAPVFVALKWAGAAYLVWLGVSAWRAASRVARAPAPSASADDADGASAAGRHEPQAKSANTGAATAYRAALLLQLGNPKAILFFTALLPQFVTPDGAWSVPVQIGVLAATGTIAELIVLLGYGWLAARAARATRDPRLLAGFERASGVCLIGCAALALAA